MITKQWKKRVLWGILVFLALVILFLLRSVRLSLIYKSYNPPVTSYLMSETPSDSTGLQGYWSFDDFTSEHAADNSGLSRHGIFLSHFNVIFPLEILSNIFDYHYAFGIPKKVEGKVGNAVQLNGRQWLSGGNYLNYNTGQFTISSWVMRSGEDDSYVPTIMAKGDWPFYNGWWLCTKPNSRYIDMGIAWGEGYKHVESGYEMPSDEWHHIAVTMNNEAHEIQFFIDGKLYGNKHENVPEWLVNWNHDLYIGDFDGSGRWPWIGKIDEVYFFDRILSAEEIFELYNKAN